MIEPVYVPTACPDGTVTVIVGVHHAVLLPVVVKSPGLKATPKKEEAPKVVEKPDPKLALKPVKKAEASPAEGGEAWTELYSKKHSRPYWKNKVTGESSWKKPPAVAAAAAASSSSS